MKNISRRSFLELLGLGGATAIAAGSLAFKAKAESQANDAPGTHDEPVLEIGENIAVASTVSGKVRGFRLRGIYGFRGIPYGASTAGKNRFMPPTPVASWSGIRPAVWWGDSAPQDMNKRWADPIQDFVDHWNYAEISEDCLSLNVWTPALDSGKRPVLVWIHGGGFTAGNAIEQDGYNGENLSRKGDIVFCSVNHRLGVFGFSNLSSALGAEFAESGNVGMLDIVAALKWVSANIENFGGDPSNVTIMGQSGGGAKVCTLAAMHSAKGLFHKAVALSGSSLHGISDGYTKKLGEYILAEAGVSKSDATKLQEMPWQQYQSIAASAAKKLRAENPGTNGHRGDFGPVGDGDVLPKGEFFEQLDGLSSDIPMIFSSVLNESSPSRNDATLERIDLAGVRGKLAPMYGDKTDSIISAYSRAFPGRSPVELWSLIASNRQLVVRAANQKSRQKAPVYLDWFGWQPPLFDGRMRAFHCSDISFWFNNTDLMFTHSGGGARPRRLADKMSSTLLQFMKTGNPNGGGLPEWPVYTEANPVTLVINDTSEAKIDPDRDARSTLPESAG